MTETYRGHVRSPADAIKLFEACRLGLLPRVQRRLSEKERQSITSGSVFVWDEREAGMRRWTDGKSWSASRVSGSFLTYREMEGKRGGGNFVPAPRRLGGKTPDSGRGSDEDADMDQDSLDGYRYKADGLLKQSFSITTSNGQHLHLISYFARQHPNITDLPQPTTDPALRHIVPVKGMYPESTVHDQAPPPPRAAIQGPYMSSPQQMMPGNAPHSRSPYPYSPGYGAWPPSPVPTPPYNYPPTMYSSQLPPPPPNDRSPHQYSPQHLPPHMQHHPAQQPYDRSPHHPHSPHDSLAPRHLSASGPPPQMSTLAYATNAARDAQHALAQAQAMQAQQLGQMHSGSRGPASVDPRLGPRVPPLHHQQQQSNGHAPPPLHHLSSPTGSRDGSLGQERQQQRSPLANGAPPQQSRSGEAQSIPSISNMVHGTPSSGPPASSTPLSASSSQQRSPGGAAQQPSPSSRLAEKGVSPTKNDDEDPKGANGVPREIPHANITGPGFGGEDLRALRVLDRKFCI
ncbi:hypothetical protein V496_02254 [Pseudogymnoascus sp. VKM F-4515 (FW-2607)]|nr:hypothetical protein V496_02254 [Pseudogymnoascus sp. VKM F-4515 (FW-2607)]KFY77891.1 hypothetical protein V498_09217 [Pseudogymnoascus sp. VKM F-4517 (FW-2822)]